ncbi:hypothetical protein BZG36_00158 [Bifiguratus adelaidae]|uniref:Integrator complex subunit 7 N-terminal domain-containing protein n=1 Tax=Bifiguratus adelaidae TaxID=1938954 RepID=A0A261Y8L6_9FUNG|nr:hypothetical protein BZG36_00158 [Bifiguratus adelaidae]
MAPAEQKDDGYKQLLELEKKFISKPSPGNQLELVARQLEAVAQFPRFFDNHSFPVIVNAGILKLADWFRNSSNSVRFQIYKSILRASERHLKKLINVDEVVRRLTPVIASNDPIARAVTLRVLGCMSPILAGNLDVQYWFAIRLENACDQELHAALYACNMLAGADAQFAGRISQTVFRRIQEPTLDVLCRQKFIQFIRHIHRDAKQYTMARWTLLDLLGDVNQIAIAETRLTITVLETLTALEEKKRIHTAEQMRLLLGLATSNQCDREIRITSLKCMVYLAKHGIEVDEGHLLEILDLKRCTSKREEALSLRFAVSAVDNMPLSRKKQWSSDPSVSVLLQQLLHKSQDSTRSNLSLALATLLLKLPHTSDSKVLQTIIESTAETISTSFKTAICKLDRASDKMRRNMQQLVRKQSIALRNLAKYTSIAATRRIIENVGLRTVCELICALARNEEGIKMVESSLYDAANACADDPSSLTILLHALVSLHDGSMSPPLTDVFQHHLEKLGGASDIQYSFKRNCWEIYKLARHLLFSGHSDLALHTFQHLPVMSNEIYGFWMRLLRDFAAIDINSKKATVSTGMDVDIPSGANGNDSKPSWSHLDVTLQKMAEKGWDMDFQHWYLHIRMIQWDVKILGSKFSGNLDTLLQLRHKVLELRSRISFLRQYFIDTDINSTKEMQKQEQTCVACDKLIRLLLCLTKENDLDGIVTELYHFYEWQQQNIANFRAMENSMSPASKIPTLQIEPDMLDRVDAEQMVYRSWLEALLRDGSKVLQQSLQDMPSIPRQFLHHIKPSGMQVRTDPPILPTSHLPINLQTVIVMEIEGILQPQSHTQIAQGRKLQSVEIKVFISWEDLRQRGSQMDKLMAIHHPTSSPESLSSTNAMAIGPPLIFKSALVSSYFSNNLFIDLCHLANEALAKSKDVPKPPLWLASERRFQYFNEAWLYIAFDGIDVNGDRWHLGPGIAGRLGW